MLVTRLSSRNASLVRFEGADIREISQLGAHLLGGVDVGYASTAGPRVYSLGPAEWLLINYSLDEIRQHLRRNSGRGVVRLTDVSQALSSLRIEGAMTRAVLASDIGTPWAAAAKPGEYAHTRLCAVDVILQCTGTSKFEVHVDQSSAAYLEEWLAAQCEAAIRPARPDS